MKKIILTFAALVISLIFILPLVDTIANSFMKESEIRSNYEPVKAAIVLGEKKVKTLSFADLKFIPDEVSIEQYYQVLIKKTKFLVFFWNSVKIVLPIILGQVLFSSMAAYAFAKMKFRFREQLFFLYIITMLMPFQVTLVPNYIMMGWLGLLGKQISVILPGIFSTFGVFLLRQFMTYIPDEYCEAAMAEGANRFEIYTRIILPMVKTGVASLVILASIDNWNMVEQPLIFLKEVKDYPLSLCLSSINAEEMGVAFAASALYMTPMLLVFLYGENYLIEGLQLSGIKG